MSTSRRSAVAFSFPMTSSPSSSAKVHQYLEPAVIIAQWSQAIQQYNTFQFAASLASHKRLIRPLISLNSLSPPLLLLQSQLWCNMAIIHASLGEYYLSIEKFENCVNINHSSVVGWYGLGIARFMLRDYGKAAEAFQKGLSAFDAAQNDNEMSEDMDTKYDAKRVAVDFFKVDWNCGINMDTNDLVALVSKQKWHLEREMIAWNAQISIDEKEKQKQNRHQLKDVPNSINKKWGLNGLPVGTLFGPPDVDNLEVSLLSLEAHLYSSLREVGQKVRPASHLRKETNGTIEMERAREGGDRDGKDNLWKARIKRGFAQYRAKTLTTLPPPIPSSTRRWDQEDDQNHEIKKSEAMIEISEGPVESNTHQFLNQHDGRVSASPEDIVSDFRLIRLAFSSANNHRSLQNTILPESTPMMYVSDISPPTKLLAFANPDIHCITAGLPGEWQKRKVYSTDRLFKVDMEEIETRKMIEEVEDEKKGLIEDQQDIDPMKSNPNEVDNGEWGPEDKSRGRKGKYNGNDGTDLGGADTGYWSLGIGDNAACFERGPVPPTLFTTQATNPTLTPPILPPLPLRSYYQPNTVSGNSPSTSTSILVPNPLNIPSRYPNASSFSTSTETQPTTKNSTETIISFTKTPLSSIPDPYSNPQTADPSLQTSLTLSFSAPSTSSKTHFQKDDINHQDSLYLFQPSVAYQEAPLVDEEGQLDLANSDSNMKEDLEWMKGMGEGGILIPRTFEGFVRRQGLG